MIHSFEPNILKLIMTNTQSGSFIEICKEIKPDKNKAGNKEKACFSLILKLYVIIINHNVKFNFE